MHIDLTPAHAYLIGFFAADGCLRHERNGASKRVVLKVKACDRGVCELALATFGMGTVRLAENNYSVVYNGPREVCEFFEHFGLTPRKTFTLALRWDLIPTTLRGAVLAGLIDGDGSVRFRDKSKTRGAGYEVKLVTASDRLRDDLQALFPGTFRVSTRPAGAEGSSSPLHRLLLETNQERTTEFLRNVYTSEIRKIALPRKWTVLEKIEAHLNSQANYDIMRGQIPTMFQSGMTMQEIADTVGLNRIVVGRIIKELAPNTKTKRWEFDEGDLALIRQMHQEGHPVKAIHAALGKATWQAVYYQINKLKSL